MSANSATSFQTPAARLGWIEAGRAIAALSVVLFHSNAILGAQLPGSGEFDVFKIGMRGVDFFFVLSGFIITLVHYRDIGTPSRTSRFAMKRFIRIYPLLWLVAAAAITLNMIVDGQTYSFAQLWTSFTLWPSSAWPTPSVTWTLRHEVLFYLLFGIAIFSRSAGMIVGGLWIILIMVQLGLLYSGSSLPGAAAMLFSPLNVQFLAGCGVALLHMHWNGRHWKWSLALGLSALIAIGWATLHYNWATREALNYASAQGVGLDLCHAIIFGLIVYGLAGASILRAAPRGWLVLGAASYAIYLFHTSAMPVVARIARTIATGGLPHGIGHLLMLVSACIAGLAAHFLFERRLARWVAMRGRRNLAQAAPAGISPALHHEQKQLI